MNLISNLSAGVSFLELRKVYFANGETLHILSYEEHFKEIQQWTHTGLEALKTNIGKTLNEQVNNIISILQKVEGKPANEWDGDSIIYSYYSRWFKVA